MKHLTLRELLDLSKLPQYRYEAVRELDSRIPRRNDDELE